MYALSQSPAQLMEHFKGGTAGDKASAECAVTREQVRSRVPVVVQ